MKRPADESSSEPPYISLSTGTTGTQGDTIVTAGLGNPSYHTHAPVSKRQALTVDVENWHRTVSNVADPSSIKPELTESIWTAPESSPGREASPSAEDTSTLPSLEEGFPLRYRRMWNYLCLQESVRQDNRCRSIIALPNNILIARDPFDYRPLSGLLGKSLLNLRSSIVYQTELWGITGTRTRMRTTEDRNGAAFRLFSRMKTSVAF
jgi:hypothetical protein